MKKKEDEEKKEMKQFRKDSFCVSTEEEADEEAGREIRRRK